MQIACQFFVLSDNFDHHFFSSNNIDNIFIKQHLQHFSNNNNNNFFEQR